jgi:hypothetical protein
MRTIALWFEHTAAFEHNEAEHEEQESGAPPIYFFHSRNCVYFYDGESSQIAAYQTKFYPCRFSFTSKI